MAPLDLKGEESFPPIASPHTPYFLPSHTALLMNN